jgi:NTE family protein
MAKMAGIRTALALGGGGTFGAYQAGVWKALHGVYEPDLVVGASIGALNGWLIASRCLPEALIEEWLSPRTAAILRPRFPRTLSGGCIGREAFEALVRDFTLRFTPAIPFAAVVSEMPTLRRRAVLAPEATWRHLCASCSVPLLMPQYRLEGRWCIDGGLVSSVPVRAAAALGATKILAVRILPRRAPLWVRAARAVLLGWSRGERREPCAAEVAMIEPEPALGEYAEMAAWRPGRVREWIERGFEDARAALAGLDSGRNVLR